MAEASRKLSLEDLYPNLWPCGFVKLCKPTPHTHFDTQRQKRAPCISPGKRPLEPGWQKRAKRLWEKKDPQDRFKEAESHLHSGGNLGLSPPKGVIVLDADDSATCELLDNLIPDAPKQVRGDSGKAHYWVAVDPELDLPNAVRVGGVFQGCNLQLDLRVHGKGQVVIAPSIHPSGDAYTWVRPLPGFPEDLRPIPASLLEHIQESKSSSPSFESLMGLEINRNTEGEVVKGSRDYFLLQTAARRSWRASSVHEVIRDVRRAATENLETYPGDDWEEILARCERHAKSGWGKYGPGGSERSEPSTSEQPDLQRLDQIEPQSVEWLWPGYLPKGKLCDVWGSGDVGKTTIALDIAARLTRGGKMPDGYKLDRAYGIVICAVEDDAADTLVPRLMAAGADLSKVVLLTHIIGENGLRRPLFLPEDIEHVRRGVAAVEAGLLILDPVMAFTGTSSSASGPGGLDAQVRTITTPLAHVAEAAGCAVWMQRHTNKDSKQSGVNRGGGSVAWRNAARAGVVVGFHPEDWESEEIAEGDCRRVFKMHKLNVGRKGEDLGFRIVSRTGVHEGEDEERGTAAIEWLGSIEGVELEDLVDGKRKGESSKSQAQLTAEWIAGRLTPGEKVEAASLQPELEARGWGSKGNVKRARDILGVRAERSDGKWWWVLDDVPWGE